MDRNRRVVRRMRSPVFASNFLRDLAVESFYAHLLSRKLPVFYTLDFEETRYRSITQNTRCRIFYVISLRYRYVNA